MDDKEYEILMGMATGKIPRNQAWLDQRAQIGAASEEAAKALRAKEASPVRTPREMELFQREYDLRLFGRGAMERLARPLDAGETRLLLPGELQKHSAEEKRPVPPKHLRLQFHDAGSEPGCKMWKV